LGSDPKRNFHSPREQNDRLVRITSMPRSARRDYRGAIHHVFGRGNHKQALFKDAADCRFFLARLGDLCKELGFILFTYCLMDNHYHLLIETRSIPLSILMQRLLTSYSRYFNDKTGSIGHVFQGRFGERLCANDTYFETLLAYIHLNPVKAGLIDRPEDWPWSGHRGLLSGTDPLIDRQRVLDKLPDGLAGYQDRIERGILNIQTAKKILSLSEIAQVVCARRGIAIDVLTGEARKRILVPVRREFIELAIAEGFSQVQVADLLKRSPRAIRKVLAKQVLLGSDPKRTSED
jgi:putative transposase